LIRCDLRHEALKRMRPTIRLLLHLRNESRLLLSGNARRCL
jgi:hypothetical protein